MRGPEGIYALDLDPEGCGEGENESWDERRLEVLLICPDGTQVRFSVTARPWPKPAGVQGAIAGPPVITAWNGSLLVIISAPARAGLPACLAVGMTSDPSQPRQPKPRHVGLIDLGNSTSSRRVLPVTCARRPPLSWS